MQTDIIVENLYSAEEFKNIDQLISKCDPNKWTYLSSQKQFSDEELTQFYYKIIGGH